MLGGFNLVIINLMSKSKKNQSTLSVKQTDLLFKTLKTRFEKNMNRHKGLKWDKIQTRLEKFPEKLWSLHQMEESGGEPDVVECNKKTGELIFFDCTQETPKGRRSVCYDRAALNSRKEHKPKNSAMDLAKDMGIEILSEEEYRYLQTLGEFDLKTSSWIKTPHSIRELGGAIFADRRYNTIFIYHNGASSYYAVRGFRGKLKI